MDAEIRRADRSMGAVRRRSRRTVHRRDDCKIAAKYERTVAQIILRWELQRGIVVIPKSVHIERMIENFNVFDFALSDEEMAIMATLDKKQSSFFSHTDPNMVEWFVQMVEQRKSNHDHSKDKKKW